jgi:hypothetical protein
MSSCRRSDRVAHAVVFAEAADRAVEEASLVQAIREEEAEGGDEA